MRYLQNDPSDKGTDYAFTQAVEEKQVAVQNKLKAETEQQQKT